MFIKSKFELLVATFFLVSATGCAATADKEETEQNVPAPVMVDKSHKDALVHGVAGQPIVLQLPSNATTGYEWSVSAKDAAFGAPLVSYVVEGEGMGAGGTTRFTWADTRTVNPGRYPITLTYARSWDPNAADTFSFVVAIDE